MGHIRDKVLKKLSAWKQGILTQAGREVMIKSVASAIPVYTMQCFLIPKKVCDEVNAAMAKFWWGQREEETTMHWIGWREMTKHKLEGGMGFRDLHAMNKACLAKQYWRLITNTDALWARVLKGIYFPHHHAWEAKRGARPS